MSIGEGSVVADVGAGRGFFTTRLARHVGLAGEVYAVDIDAGNIDRLQRLSGDDGLTQVSVVQGTTTERSSKPFSRAETRRPSRDSGAT
jgi:ubiquinone/menaquinone biosynthesis C-methylase UbiE